MRFLISLSIIAMIIFSISCASGPKENPDGKYGSAVPKNRITPFKELGPKRGEYLKQEIVLTGVIEEIDSLSGSWFKLRTPDGGIKCTIEDFGLPQSLVGKEVYVRGILDMVLAAAEKGRPIGGDIVAGADPTGSKYDDELRLRVKGVEVAPQDLKKEY
jgi:hypothetical protein